MKKFIHLTDLHLSSNESLNKHNNFNSQKTLKKLIKKINSINPLPDFILISGDLTNSGDIKSYECLKEIISQILPPTFLAIGNHDKRITFNQVFNNTKSSKPYFYNHLFEYLNLITLDTSSPGKISGEISVEQFKFLKKSLSVNKNTPTLIMMHHPPRFSEKSPNWISLDYKSTKNLQSILAGHNIQAILCGHLHINQVNFWHNIPVIISNGLFSTVDFLENDELSIVEGTSFNLCSLRENGIGVSVIPISPKGKVLKKLNLKRFKNLK